MEFTVLNAYKKYKNFFNGKYYFYKMNIYEIQHSSVEHV